MIGMILAHPHLFWLSLGGLLLAAEMLGGSGYLLWSGVAGVVTGALTWLLPLSWEWQGTLFAVLTLLAAWLWSKWLRKRVKTQRPADAQLNQRGQQLVGRRLTLDAPLVNGRGHVRVGDSSWPVIADEDFAAGSKVEVIAVEGITLRIRPAVPLSLRLAMAAAGKIIDNRALRAVVAGAGFGQRQQVRAHILQLADMVLDIRHFLQRAFFHIGAVPRRVVEQGHQLAALFQVKPHLPRLAQQRQLIEMLLTIGAVAVFAPQRRRHQPLLFIKTNRFAG